MDRKLRKPGRERVLRNNEKNMKTLKQQNRRCMNEHGDAAYTYEELLEEGIIPYELD